MSAIDHEFKGRLDASLGPRDADDNTRRDVWVYAAGLMAGSHTQTFVKLSPKRARAIAKHMMFLADMADGIDERADAGR